MGKTVITMAYCSFKNVSAQLIRAELEYIYLEKENDCSIFLERFSVFGDINLVYETSVKLKTL